MLHEYIFDNSIEKLKEVFGERYFTDARKKIIWDGIKDLSDKWLNKTTDNFLSAFKSAPLPIDFFEAAIIERNKNGVVDRIGDCEICNGFGSYMLIEKYKDIENETDNYLGNYAYRCTCVAKVLKPNFPFKETALSL